jgi:hypothetical protein
MKGFALIVLPNLTSSLNIYMRIEALNKLFKNRGSTAFVVDIDMEFSINNNTIKEKLATSKDCK